MNIFNWGRKEKRNDEPKPVVEQNACTEVAEGVALLNKLLSLKDYDALSQSPFFCAISLITNSLASMRWNIKANDNDVDVPDNFYALHLFDHANVGRFMTVKNMISDMILYGNGFAYIKRSKNGDAEEIIYLPMGECNIVYNKATRTLLYQAPRVSSSLIEPINILHFKMLSINGVEGRSLLSFANNTIKLSGSADKAAQEYFNNGLQVQGILSTDTPRLTKDQRQSIRQAWNESQLGAGTGLAVLEGGMKYQAISSNSKDAQLLETRVFNVTEVARWFNMSPVMLGDLTKMSYNTLEQAQLQFVLNTLSPYIVMMEEELNSKLISYKDKTKYFIDIAEDDIVRSDKQSQVSYLTTLCEKGILTVNEVRENLGYSPVEGGDELHALYTDTEQNKITGEDKNTEEEQDE